jgi:hypothetical protein
MTGPLVGLLIALVIASFVGGPIVMIWAVNMLFGLAIPVNAWTWFAMLVLWAAFGRSDAR